MPRFRKKPGEIEAVQFTGSTESGAAIMAWANRSGATEVIYHPFLADYSLDSRVYVAQPNAYMRIVTLEGAMIASVGDWVIRGVKGEFYPCKPDIFEATYEPVTEDGESCNA